MAFAEVESKKMFGNASPNIKPMEEKPVPICIYKTASLHTDGEAGPIATNSLLRGTTNRKGEEGETEDDQTRDV